MREVDTFALPQTNNAPITMKKATYVKGRRIARHRMETTIPVMNNNIGGQSFTGAALLALLQTLFGSFTSYFLPKKGDKRILDNAMSFDQLREMAIAQTGQDVLVSVSGVMTPLSTIIASGINIQTIPGASTVNFKVEVPRHYTFRRFGRDERDFALGPTQASSMAFDIKRGSGNSFGTYFSQNGPASIVLIADDFDDSNDTWSEPPRLLLTDNSGRGQDGPGGMLLAAWERSNIGPSTALTFFSMKRENDEPLHDNVQALRVVDDSSYELPPGWIDLNSLQTVLWQAGAQASLQHMPTSRQFFFYQPANDLAPAHIAWLHVPNISEGDSDAISKFYTGPDEQPVKLVNTWKRRDRSAPSHIVSCSPLVALRPGQRGYDTSPGRGTSSDGTTHKNDLPATAASAASSAPATAAGANDPAGASDAASTAAADIADLIPGGAGPSRKEQPIDTRSAVVNSLPKLKSASPVLMRLPH
jgi:hypothetical protein